MLKKITYDEFDAVYKIMQDSFPKNEIRSYSGQRKLLAKNEYSMFAIVKNASVIGFIALWTVSDFLFVEHFALSEQYRGKGIGSQILNEIKLRFSLPIVLEVEPPVDKKTSKRIAFYEKNGFTYHDFYYVQPALEKTREQLQLKIMSTKRLSEQDFNRVRDALYKDIYKVI